MAISRALYTVISRLRRDGQLPRGEALLEIGEANWYGDVGVDELRADVAALTSDAAERDALLALVDAADRAPDRWFALARSFYRAFFDPSERVAVDLDGTATALRHDLNAPLDLGRRFGVAINNGTAEHIFFAGQVFASMHAHTRPGGLMIHEGPLVQGWVDHGFFNFQPTLFFDLAAANDYQLALHAGGLSPFALTRLPSRDAARTWARSDERPADPIFVAVFRKPAAEVPFRIPVQGYYASALSADGRKAWRSDR